MKLDTGLKELERQFSLCIKCKQCTYGSWPENLPVCPINDRYRFFTYSGGGIIYLARAILLGLIEEDLYEQVLEVVSKCTNCQFCGQTCKLVKVAPPYQNVTDLIRLVKIHLVKKGIYLSDKHRASIDFINGRKRAFAVSEAEEKELTRLKSNVPNKGSTLVFSGCVTSYKNRENLKAVIEILNGAGVNYHVMDDEWCCGAPLLDLGTYDGIGELADHHFREIKKKGINKIVFLCPHCHETFKHVYPQLTKKTLDFELTFVTRYLMQLIDDKKLRISKSVPVKVSYHDPCTLVRTIKDADSARSIFQRIPGLQLAEMRRNKEDTYCCGAGGGTIILDPENARAIGQERARDFMRTGAEVLVTSCPLCKSQFRGVSQAMGKNIAVKDLVEIVRDSVG